MDPVLLGHLGGTGTGSFSELSEILGSSISLAEYLAASAAELAVKKKVNKYAHLLDNYIFVPFAVETFGPWSHDAKVLVSQIGQILISITGDRRCTTYLRQRLSIAIQRGNAMSVLGTLPESSPLDELFLL
ncbi:hypothetical protein ANN_24060 [Periplaneta americana]|uniref:Uncharacterized protein n=1 Tax=Periplaneta americana TaxID=6978 RepID=A0ABQ8S2K3_PERAM|nr:hypothetical protein ANN_24060 [Periplaneta americana]